MPLSEGVPTNEGEKLGQMQV